MKSVSLITALFLLVLSQNIWSQCPALSCNDRVQISLETDCESVITPDMLIESGPGDLLTVEIYGDADTLLGNVLTGLEVGQDLSYKISNDCGNSCWGNITLEYNQPLPFVDVPCAFVPGVKVVRDGALNVLNTSDSLMITAVEDCQRTLLITVFHRFAYNGGVDANGEPIWVDDQAVITLLDENGIEKATFQIPRRQTVVEVFSTLGPLGKCTAVIAPLNENSFGDYTLQLELDNCGVNPDCFSYCGSVPTAFITVDELEAEFGAGCVSPLIGDIRVEQTITGDICSDDGELIVVTYSGTVERHGEREKIDFLTQAYRTEKLSLAPAASGSGTVTPVFFPDDISLGCNAEASPEAILAQTGSGTLAFPHYVDIHNFVTDTIITPVVEHILVPVDTVEEMTLVTIDVDGDGDTEQVWTLVPVVVKETVEVISLDTTFGGLVNPIILIEDQICNLVSTFSDEEFPACEGGKKLIRHWSIIDWCDGNSIISDFQTIEMFDIEPPVVLQPADIVISIDPWTCTASIPLPDLEITDDCATEFNISTSTTSGRLENGILVDLPAQDSLPVNLVIADGCGNETTTNFYVTVIDMIQPVTVCVDNLTVTLTTGGETGFEGIAKIQATDFDAGSHDAGCSDVTIQVIRVDDTQDMVWDCEGNEIGYLPVSCRPNTEAVDLICMKDGSQFAPAAIPGDEVAFCCADVGQLVPVMVIVTDQNGNKNHCIVDVSVVNKGGGALVCEPVSIACTADLDDLSAPFVIGGVCASDLNVQLLSETSSEITCGDGTIIREWFIDLDLSGDLSGGDGFCEQTISIDPILSSFDPFTIKWPKHYDGTTVPGINFECNVTLDDVDSAPINVQMGDPFTCMAGTQDNRPVWCETDCGLIGFSVESDTLTGGDACRTVVNSWTVIDWCVFEANQDDIDDENDLSTDNFIAVEDWAQGLCASCPEFGPAIDDPVYFMYEEVDLDGYYTFDQVIKIVDDSDPQINLTSDTIFVNTIGDDDGKIGERNCVGSELLTADAVDFCNGVESPAEALEWFVEVVDLDGNPVNNADGLNSRVVRGPFATINTRPGSPGDVRLVRWRVDDGCGNIGFATQTIIFRDLKAPSPVCVAGLTTVFMEDDGTAVIWAEDFNLGSFDNCTNTEDLRYSIVRQGDDPIFPGEEGFGTQTSYTIFCDSILTSLVDFDMYVFDINGLGDFCTVSLMFSNGCDIDQGGNSAMISGIISTPEGRMVENVEVNLTTALPEYPISGLTGAEGSYAFGNNPMNQTYSISASMDEDHDNGVSTLDLVLIQKHILGISPIDNPYVLIAADATNDGNVSSIDLLELRKVILGIQSELSNNSSWRFVSESFQFFDSSNPWPFQETLEIANLEHNMMSENFVGIKIGDINESANVNQFSSSEIRYAETLTFSLTDQVLEVGETYQIALASNQSVEITGLQFGLDHNDIEVLNISSTSAKFDESHYVRNSNQTLISWPIGNAIAAQNELLLIEFRVSEKILLSEAIQLQSTHISNGMSAEAYKAKTDEIMEIALEFENQPTVKHDFLVAQNDPNPFKDFTRIQFQLPEASLTTVTIHSVRGELLWQQSSVYSKGFNEIEIHKSEVELAAGSYIYTVESGPYSTAKKMIVIE